MPEDEATARAERKATKPPTKKRKRRELAKSPEEWLRQMSKPFSRDEWAKRAKINTSVDAQTETTAGEEKKDPEKGVPMDEEEH